MDDIRTGDVLRLFFGKEHKHYLTLRVGQSSLKLKNERGEVVLLKHDAGKLSTLGDAAITGFEVLKDPKRYAHYKVGSDVDVKVADLAFRAEILENDDGLLKVRVESGRQLYVDLDHGATAELLDHVPLAENEAPRLPDEVADLFFLNLFLETKRPVPRLYELYRNRPPPLEFPFLVPVLDHYRCKVSLLATDQKNDDFVSGLIETGTSAPVVRVTSASGSMVALKGETVLFDQTVYPDKVAETYTFVADPSSKLPVAEYALVRTDEFRKLHFLTPNFGLHLRSVEKTDPRFETVTEALAAYAPDLSTAKSAFQADVLSYPVPLKPEHLHDLVKTVLTPYSKPKHPAHKKEKKSRYTLGDLYKGLIPEHLSTSETLNYMLSIDYGEAYFTKKTITPKIQRVQRVSVSKTEPYAKEVVGIWNVVYQSFFEGDYEKFLSLVQKYARPGNEKDSKMKTNTKTNKNTNEDDPVEIETRTKTETNEDRHWLYFTVPTFSKCKFVPVAMEKYARRCLYRGKTGAAELLFKEMTQCIFTDGVVVDSNTGIVLSKGSPPEKKNQNKNTVALFLQSQPINYSEEDLIVLNLARRLANMVGGSIKNEAHLLNQVRSESSDPYTVACTVAAYVAHFGNLPVGTVAEALRFISKRRIWRSVLASKELTADVAKFITRFESAKPRVAHEPWKRPASSPVASSVVPALERNVTMVKEPLKPKTANRPWTVVAGVGEKQYEYLGDVFGSDLTAKESLARCTPHILSILSPNETSFFKFIGSRQDNRALYDFIFNVACFVPTLLVNGRRDFQQNVAPAGKHADAKFLERWTALYAPLLIMDVPTEENDVASRFAVMYNTKKATFRRLTAVAKTALWKNDGEMLEACAVRSVYLHMVNDMSEETEKYVQQLVRTCVHLYRNCDL
jgi:hypothetical protein